MKTLFAFSFMLISLQGNAKTVEGRKNKAVIAIATDIMKQNEKGINILHSDVNIYSNTDIFSNNSDFSNIIFTEDTYFKNKFIHNETSFMNSTFLKKADFSNSYFAYPIWFKGSKFNDLCNHTDASFSDYANFERVIFKDSVSFKSSKFYNLADFNNSTFNGNIDFSNTKFNRQLNFRNCKIDGKLNFRSCEFIGNALFGNCVFNNDIDFKSSIFRQKARFYKCKFKKTDFIGSIFNDQANFLFAEFSDKAMFYATEFNKHSKFGLANFKDEASFTNAKFIDGVDFSFARFDDAIYFDNTIFNKTIDITGTTFKNGLDLRGAKLNDAIIYFDHHTNFPKGMLFVEWDHIANRLIVNDNSCQNYRRINKLIETKKTNTNHERNQKNEINKRLDSLNNELNMERLVLTEIFYKKLSDNYKAQDNRSAADGVMYELSERKQKYSGNLLWGLYGLTFGYGYKPLRFAATIFLIIIPTFSLLWYHRFYNNIALILNATYDKNIISDSKSEKNFKKVKILKLFPFKKYEHRNISKEINIFARIWHVLYFSSSVLLSIRFKSDWIHTRDKLFLFWITTEWIFGIFLYALFAILVKSHEFNYVKGLLGF